MRPGADSILTPATDRQVAGVFSRQHAPEQDGLETHQGHLPDPRGVRLSAYSVAAEPRRPEGWPISKKKTRRIYCELCLQFA